MARGRPAARFCGRRMRPQNMRGARHLSFISPDLHLSSELSLLICLGLWHAIVQKKTPKCISLHLFNVFFSWGAGCVELRIEGVDRLAKRTFDCARSKGAPNRHPISAAEF